MRRATSLLVALALTGSACAAPLPSSPPSPSGSPLVVAPVVVAPVAPTPMPSVAVTPSPTATPNPTLDPEVDPGFDTPIDAGVGVAPDPFATPPVDEEPTAMPIEAPVTVSSDVLPARDGYLAFGSWSAAGRKIAFTFDDGGSERAIRGVVAVAAATGTPVTFFPFGRSLRRYPELWREIAAAGFPIGNHTLAHRFLERLRLRSGADAVYHEIRGFAELAAEERIPLIPVLRPPYGEHSPAVDAIAARAGFPYVATWNTTFADTAPLCGGSVARHFAFTTRGKGGAIVLAHVSDELTPRILAAVIAHYRERNLTPVSLPELLGGEIPTIDWAKAAAIGGTLPVPLDVTDSVHTPAELLGRPCAS